MMMKALLFIFSLFISSIISLPTANITNENSTANDDSGGGAFMVGSGADIKNLTHIPWETIVSNLGYPSPSTKTITNFYEALSLHQNVFSSLIEAAMFIAQVIHESGGLCHLQEIRCVPNNCPSEYSTPELDRPGKQYFGRGYLQLTWARNYHAFSQQVFGDGNLLLDSPEKVAQDELLAWRSALWFWQSVVHPVVQTGRFGESTRAINGYLECSSSTVANEKAKKRFSIYKQVLAAMLIPEQEAIEDGCY